MPIRRSKSRNSSKALKLPGFKGVEGKVTVPAGDYAVEVASVEVKEGNEADYFAWKFKITEGKYKGSTLYYNTSLAEQALWNLKGLLEVIGVEIEDEPSELDISDLEGLTLNVSVELEKYQGKNQSKVVDYWSDGEDREEEEENPRRGRQKKEDEDEEEEKSTRRSRKSKDDEEEKPSRRSRKTKDEDEEEEKSSRSSRNSKKKKKDAELTQEEISDMDEKELEDLVEEHELDVDLSKFKTVGKMRSAVIDAAEEAGILEQE